MDADAIVRMLAARTPYEDDWNCYFCCSHLGEKAEWRTDPSLHEPDCLWRLAREWRAGWVDRAISEDIVHAAIVGDGTGVPEGIEPE